MDRIKLVVYNEYVLGYIIPEQPYMVNTLANSVLRGASFRMMFEPYYIGAHDTVRLADRQDFEDFRVVFDGYDNTEEYEFDTNQYKKIQHYYNRKNRMRLIDRREKMVLNGSEYELTLLWNRENIRRSCFGMCPDYAYIEDRRFADIECYSI